MGGREKNALQEVENVGVPRIYMLSSTPCYMFRHASCQKNVVALFFHDPLLTTRARPYLRVVTLGHNHVVLSCQWSIISAPFYSLRVQ
jgi:hypothetical protein